MRLLPGGHLFPFGSEFPRILLLRPGISGQVRLGPVFGNDR